MKYALRLAPLAMLLACGPEQDLTSQSVASEDVTSSRSAVVTSTIGDTAFISFGDQRSRYNAVGRVNSDRTVTVLNQTTSPTFPGNAKATMNRNGWVFVTYTDDNKNPSTLKFAYGKLTAPSSVSWVQVGNILALGIGSTDHDVAISPYNEVVFAWAGSAHDSLYYATCQVNDWTSTINWFQTGVAIPGDVANPRLAIGGGSGDQLVLVSKPKDSTKRNLAAGRLNWQDTSYTISLNLGQPSRQLTGRATTDGVYDIAMDANGGFSLAWTNNAQSRSFLYHMDGKLESGGTILLWPANELSNAACNGSVGFPSGSCRIYRDPSVGRSADGNTVLVASPQEKIWPVNTSSESVWIHGMSRPANGSLSNMKLSLLFSTTEMNLLSSATIAY